MSSIQQFVPLSLCLSLSVCPSLLSSPPPLLFLLLSPILFRTNTAWHTVTLTNTSSNLIVSDPRYCRRLTATYSWPLIPVSVLVPSDSQSRQSCRQRSIYPLIIHAPLCSTLPFSSFLSCTTAYTTHLISAHSTLFTFTHHFIFFCTTITTNLNLFKVIIRSSVRLCLIFFTFCFYSCVVCCKLKKNEN